MPLCLLYNQTLIQSNSRFPERFHVNQSLVPPSLSYFISMPFAPSFRPNHLNLIRHTVRPTNLRNITTAVAMSGGVDSSVAAALLQQVQRVFVDDNDV